MLGSGRTPDDDAVWMSRSSVFVSSGGGFSKLVSDCVEYLGGVALRPSDGRTFSSPLEQTCWTAPRPDAVDRTKNYSWENDGWSGREPWSGRKNYPPEETVW